VSHHSFYFDPEEKGVRVFLGQTESNIMEVIWQRGELTVKKTLFHMDAKDAPAYTTVMTIMARLARKGILKKRKVGRGFVYSPAVSRSDFLKAKVQIVKDCLSRNSGG
jgi:predicted transcriptional regulator